jgi:hypothetical protein
MYVYAEVACTRAQLEALRARINEWRGRNETAA